RPLSDGYEEIGLAGELALERFTGVPMDMTRRPGGDGGRDCTITLATDFHVDVKAARKPFNLIVEAGKVRPRTIYILASYDDKTGEAELLGWEWGKKVLKAPIRDFGHGVFNHFIPRRELRHLDELKQRLIPINQS